MRAFYNEGLPQTLLKLRQDLDNEEGQWLSPYACHSTKAIRRFPDPDVTEGHRQFFSVDTDRILHSLAYSRYIDKTQVFYLIKNDHITHRVLHVQLVSKIARTIGRLLRLNEDLIEAVALGHDIGHAPFGHDGERFLSRICQEHSIGHFVHNVQGVRFLQDIERKGRGWNLSLQVLDGILCHDGELHQATLCPSPSKDFETFDKEVLDKTLDPSIELRPMTLEACVVRLADTISYIGRDIEDAIRLKIISREDIPKGCREILGDTNGKIVYNLVSDLVFHSLNKPFLSFSKEVGAALGELKEFNKKMIYENPFIKRETGKIELMFNLLFEKYMKDILEQREDSDIFISFLEGMSPRYLENSSPPAIVRDFIAGMTDDYFLNQCQKHLVPQVKSYLFS